MPNRRRPPAAGTALRALRKNLIHMHRRLRDPRLPDAHRRALEQSVAALTRSLHSHQTLRAHMATVLFG